MLGHLRGAGINREVTVLIGALLGRSLVRQAVTHITVGADCHGSDRVFADSWRAGLQLGRTAVKIIPLHRPRIMSFKCIKKHTVGAGHRIFLQNASSEAAVYPSLTSPLGSHANSYQDRPRSGLCESPSSEVMEDITGKL